MTLNIREDIRDIMYYIENITETLGDKLDKSKYYIEYMGCPHTYPKKLPDGYAAIYMFACKKENGEYEFLKIGKANPKSSARFVSQHYGFNAPSTLAKSICRDEYYINLGVNVDNVKEWMFNNLYRINIYIRIDNDTAITELVEVILHYKFRPKYEGNIGK